MDDNIKNKLTQEQYDVCFNAGTEAPFSGKYHNHKERGMYKCIACGNELFASDTKFDSGTGWPSFWDFADKNNVKTKTDTSHGMVRTEVKCAKCDAHLGHVFTIGSEDTPKRYYCINSLALDFEKKE